MKVFQCNKCGIVIPKKKILQNVETMRQEGLITRETEVGIKQELKKEKPYIRCHNPQCSGLLEQTDSESLQDKLKKQFET